MSEEVLLMIYLGIAALAALIAVRIATLRSVGDDLEARLDELAEGGVGEALGVPSTARYDRFERRDYSGDRGGTPDRADAWYLSWTDFYAETAARLGLDPLGA